jgi:predicted permease
MPTTTFHELRRRSRTHRTARQVLFAFLVTFVVSRLFVLFMAEGRLPDFHMRFGETHVHHLALGIFLLAAVGAGLLFVRPQAGGLRLASTIYGIGLALTFDEFGMWLHLEDVYWQRASFDAIAVIAALLGIVAAGPSLRRLRPRHWKAAVGLGLAVALFLALVLIPLWSAGRNFGTHLR